MMLSNRYVPDRIYNFLPWIGILVAIISASLPGSDNVFLSKLSVVAEIVLFAYGITVVGVRGMSKWN